MTSLPDLLREGATNAWLFIPTAVALGALHGLEPGHSKSMMAAFIVAVRGTPAQAALLGLCAAASHTAVVWAVALAGLYVGAQWSGERVEAVFQIVSAVFVIGIALAMLWRLSRPADHDHDDDYDHDHDGLTGDAHARAHADDIARRFGGGTATTGQIVMFGLTGGLIPCPASIAVLLLCLQLKRITLGVALVLCFSLGLALTLIGVGVAAALGARHLGGRVSTFAVVARYAPYLSVALLLLVGLYSALVGVEGFAATA